MPYATVDDVQNAYEQPIPDDLATFVATQLEVANTLLDARVPSLASRLTSAPGLAVLARHAVVVAVLRVLRNPDGFKGEHGGEYGYYYGTEASSGRVAFSAEDLQDLMPSGNRARVRSVGLDDDALCEPTRRRRLRQDVVQDPVTGDILLNFAQQPDELLDSW